MDNDARVPIINFSPLCAACVSGWLWLAAPFEWWVRQVTSGCVCLPHPSLLPSPPVAAIPSTFAQLVR